jgi:hypothetical protein
MNIGGVDMDNIGASLLLNTIEIEIEIEQK